MILGSFISNWKFYFVLWLDIFRFMVLINMKNLMMEWFYDEVKCIISLSFFILLSRLGVCSLFLLMHVSFE